MLAEAPGEACCPPPRGAPALNGRGPRGTGQQDLEWGWEWDGERDYLLQFPHATPGKHERGHGVSRSSASSMAAGLLSPPTGKEGGM